jgi:hypothetical protein
MGLPVKIKFSAPILDMEKNPVKEGDKDVTLGSVSCTALLATYPDEKELSGDDKVKRFRLAEAAVAGGEQEVKVEDAALLKKLIAKAYAPLVVGRAYDIIEPPSA